MTAVAELVTRVNSLKTRVDEAAKTQTASSEKLTVTQADLEAKASGAKPCPDEASGYKTRAEAAKPKVTAIPGINDIAKELHKFAVPEPDFCLPLVSNIDLERGFGNVTFTRSTIATYVDKTGVLRTANANEPRFEKEGILIEGSSTNLMTYSHRESGSGFFDNTVTLPDGKTPAIKLTRQSHQERASWDNIYKVTSGAKNPITTSLFIKAGNSDTVYFTARRYYEGVDSYEKYEVVDHTFSISKGWESKRTDYWIYHDPVFLNDGWVRVSFTSKPMKDGFHNMSSGSMYVTHYVDSRSKVGDYIYLGGVQAEELPFATSYIPTTGSAVSRGQDNLVIPVSCNLPPQYSAITTAATYNTHGYLNYSANKGQGAFYYSSGGRYALIGDTLQSIKNLSAQYRGARIVGLLLDNLLNTAVIQTDGSKLKAYANGSLMSEATNTGVAEYAQDFEIGKGSSGGSWCLFGHVRDFRIWHTALTDDQIAML